MGRKICLPYELKFCFPPDAHDAEDNLVFWMAWAITVNYVSQLRRKVHDIHKRVRRNIQSTSDRMKGSGKIYTRSWLPLQDEDATS